MRVHAERACEALANTEECMGRKSSGERAVRRWGTMMVLTQGLQQGPTEYLCVCSVVLRWWLQ